MAKTNKNEKKDKPVIVVKRIKKVHGGHHGGAWKIAYADFITAMMAFFLLLWLLGSLNKYQLQGISKFFKTPLSEVVTMKILGKKEDITSEGSAGDSSLPKRGLDNVGPDLKKETEAKIYSPTNTSKNKIKAQKKSQENDKPQQKEIDKAKELIKKAELKELEKLKQMIQKAIQKDKVLKANENQIKIDLMDGGLRIQLVDLADKPMFPLGSSDLEPTAKIILKKLAQKFNNVPNKLLISGHTDSNPYSGAVKDYSNWELSVERANSTRRELIADGLAKEKVIRIAGLADTVPLNTIDPSNPTNRRISIILLTTDKEANIKQE